MREYLKNLQAQLIEDIKKTDNFRDNNMLCDEHYDLVSKQYGLMCEYSEILAERITFEDEYIKAIIGDKK